MWDKRQKRAFHRLLSGVKMGGYENRKVVHLVLTSAPGTEMKDLNRCFDVFWKRVTRRFGRIPYCKVKTSEGFGVFHVLYRSNRIIPQVWVSDAWSSIRKGSIVVHLRRLYGSARKAAGYIAAQYCGGQNKFLRLSLSRDWLPVGFPEKWKLILWRSGVITGSYPDFVTDLSRLPVAFEMWDSWLREKVSERLQTVL